MLIRSEIQIFYNVDTVFFQLILLREFVYVLLIIKEDNLHVADLLLDRVNENLKGVFVLFTANFLTQRS